MVLTLPVKDPCPMCQKVMLVPNKYGHCSACSERLRGLKFDGEELLHIVRQILPPMPLNMRNGQVPAVPIPAIHEVTEHVLVKAGVLIKEPTNEDAGQPGEATPSGSSPS